MKFKEQLFYNLYLFISTREKSFFRKIRELVHIIDATLTLLNIRIGSYIEIEKQYGSNLEVECVPGALNHVFLNILNNAIDATINGGKISVQTQVVSKTCRISISDTGKGIPEESDHDVCFCEPPPTFLP